MMNKLKFLAACPLEKWDDHETSIPFTIREAREAVERVKELEQGFRDLLYSRVSERLGFTIAQDMERTNWKAWPPAVTFVDARLERARKALIGP